MRKLFVIAFSFAGLSAQAALFDWENAGLGNFPSISQTVLGITATATGGTQGVDVADLSASPGWAAVGN